MNKLFFLFALHTSLCQAQQQAPQYLPPSSQSHAMPSWIQQYSWDTIGNSWTYVKTIDITYAGNHASVSYTHDTVNAIPIQMDSTSYDSLGRITALWSAMWTGVWMNGSRTEYIYTDTSTQNRIRFRYAGNGYNWTLIQGDSVYNIFDAFGNSIEKYFYLYNIGSGIFKPSNFTLTDYDIANRVQRRRNYSYDINIFQYVLGMVDSNFTYDAVYTTQVTDQVQYTVTNGIYQPFYWRKLHYPGPSIVDWTETALQWNANTQQWDPLHRWTYTSQSCDNIDTAYLETWNALPGTWEMTSGTKDIFNWADSCDYDEFIIQTYYSHLNGYRNDVKWVYPPDGISSVESEVIDNSIKIFPNPFHSTAIFENRNGKMENCCLNIYNSMGSLVREDKILNLSLTSYIAMA
jgi:hypothetical protein